MKNEVGFQPITIASLFRLGIPSPATLLIHAAALHTHSVTILLLGACDVLQIPHGMHFTNSEQNFSLCPMSLVAQEAQSTNGYNYQLYNVSDFLLFEHDWNFLISWSATLILK